MPTIVYGMQQLAQNVIGVTVPKSGHWIPEERPDFVIKMLDKFFAGNSIKTKWQLSHNSTTMNTKLLKYSWWLAPYIGVQSFPGGATLVDISICTLLWKQNKKKGIFFTN